jgi:NAD(P)-dependent dehydrogenase (short-subunit alcohol dehydrogenase family)
MQIDGGTVFITGGSGGIGRALAEAFRAGGAMVVTADLPGLGADVDLDVTDAAAVEAAIGALDRLDVVVANAGIGIGGLVEDVDRAGWDRSIDVNVRGVVNTVLPAYARMRSQGSGQIVLVASLAGLAGTPLLTPYAMTKGALVSLGASLRPEAARHGVGVTTVCPGPVETPLLDAETATAGTSPRRYLVASAGTPLAPDDLAGQVVDAVRKDRPLLIPGRAKLLWRLSRYAPNLTNQQIAKGMQKELDAAAG